MKKKGLKYFVTALLFVDLSSVVILGLLMAFVIPSGNVPMEAKTFLGLHRSKWADIHDILSLILMGLIAWHIRLSWDWVVGTTKKYFGEQWQKDLWTLSGAWLLVVLLAWVVVSLR